MAPLPHAKEVLAKLKKRYRLFLLSDPDGGLAIKMKRIALTGLTKYFEGFILGDELKTTKPSKKYYEYLRKKYDVDMSSSIMVGDRPAYDLITAKKFGMTTIWMENGRWAEKVKNRKFDYVDYTIKDLRQLLRLL
jgi:putative hydrolase of the HAD superfamily